MKRLVLSLVLSSATAAVFGQSSPIAVTGFNKDAIAEGGSGHGTAADVAASTNITLDGNWDFFAQGFDSQYPTIGLPTGLQFTSALDHSTVFQFQPYKGNNVLLLGRIGGHVAPSTGSLSLSSATEYSKVSFLVDGFNGSHSVNYTLNFAGGSTMTGSFTAPDNFFQPNPAISGFGRVNVNGGFGAIDGSGHATEPQMYQIDVAISGNFQTLALDSVTFANQATSDDSNGNPENVGIFAMSGVQAVPEPCTLTLMGLGALALLKRKRG